MSIQFYTGAQVDPIDVRDRIFQAPVGGTNLDWEKGFDIREVLGGGIEIKNQGSSLSCVGQAWSYYVWVLQVLEMCRKYQKNLTQIRNMTTLGIETLSAKAFYSQIALANGGAYLRDGGLLAVKWGAVREDLVPSYVEGNPPTEAFMRDNRWLNESLNTTAKILRAKESQVIQGWDINLMATAIQNNFGVIGGVVGSNNQSWLTLEPQPPRPEDNSLWLHCIFYGAFGQDQKGKFIATPNSWGDIGKHDWKPGDPPGKGWQKLYENYFVQGLQFNPWTLTDKPNEENLKPKFGYEFKVNLQYGMNHSDVKQLQKLLLVEGFFPKEMSPTGFYGNITARAVMKLQSKYSIMRSKEINELEGKHFGPKSRAKINSLYPVL